MPEKSFGEKSHQPDKLLRSREPCFQHAFRATRKGRLWVVKKFREDTWHTLELLLGTITLIDHTRKQVHIYIKEASTNSHGSKRNFYSVEEKSHSWQGNFVNLSLTMVFLRNLILGIMIYLRWLRQFVIFHLLTEVGNC